MEEKLWGQKMECNGRNVKLTKNKSYRQFYGTESTIGIIGPIRKWED